MGRARLPQMLIALAALAAMVGGGAAPELAQLEGELQPEALTGSPGAPLASGRVADAAAGGLSMPAAAEELLPGGAVGRLLQEADGPAGNATNGTDATAGPGAAPVVGQNFTKICLEGQYPSHVPECIVMLLDECEATNYTLALCLDRGVDECSRDNGGCGDPEYIVCDVRTWLTWGTELGNLSKVRLPTNWTDGTGLSEGANVTEWKVFDITWEENQTMIDGLFADGGETFLELGDIPVSTLNREQGCTDIDECLVENGGCGDPQYARCENKYSRPVRCRDINECESDNGGCGDPLYSRCINYENQNKKDFIVTTPRKHTCRDIDECQTNNGGCGDAQFFSCSNRGGEGGGVYTPDEASSRDVGPQFCNDIDECLEDNGSCGSDRYFTCENMWGAGPICTEVCLSIYDPGFSAVGMMGEGIANYSFPGNPCTPNELDFWECRPACIEQATALADHGCYGVYLSDLHRKHDQYKRMIVALDAEYHEQYPTRNRPTSTDPPSRTGVLLSHLRDITSRCYGPLLSNPNRTHEYRDMLPILPCDVMQATKTVYGILDEYSRTCPMDGSTYDTVQMLDEQMGSATRNQIIDVNVTHTVCNNDVCTSSLLLAAASLRPLLSVCRDVIATDGHYWTSNDKTLRNCPASALGGRTYTLLQTCAAPSYGPGPGLFPNPQIPCSSECNSLIRSEEELIKDLIAMPEADVDKDVLDSAFYQLQDECQAAFPAVWFKPRYDRGLLFGVSRSGFGPGGTLLPNAGIALGPWAGHGHDGSAAQPALMALDASTGRVYPVSTLPIHEHTPGMVCFDEKNQVYYLIGLRLSGGCVDDELSVDKSSCEGDSSFEQTTHLIGVSVLSGQILVDVPFPYRVVSMRYDNVNSEVLAVVMHSARMWGSEATTHVFDSRAMVKVSTIDGTITRVGMRVLPEEEFQSSPSVDGVQVCSSASSDDHNISSAAAQLKCPQGMIIGEIEFASFGTPQGVCGNYSFSESCHAEYSVAVVEATCLTMPACALSSDLATWGSDPCPTSLKWLHLQARCVLPRNGRHKGDVFSLTDTHATVGMAVVDPVEGLYYTVVHPKARPYDAILLAINTDTGVIRWETLMPHALTQLALNKRHRSEEDALQPPFAFPHYRGIDAQRQPTLASYLNQGRLIGVGGEGTLQNHHMLYVDPLNSTDPVIHHSRLFDQIVNKSLHTQESLRLDALAEELAFNQTLGWAMAVISNNTNATTVEEWMEELDVIYTFQNLTGTTGPFNASLICQPFYEDATGHEYEHQLFDPFRCLESMGVNQSTLERDGVDSVMDINATIWPFRDWVYSKILEKDAAYEMRLKAEHNAWLNSVYDGDTRSRFSLALSAFDSVTGVFYSLIDDWTGQSRIVGINSTDGDVISNKTTSSPIQDIFLSELPYVMRLDPWSGMSMGETMINVTSVNLDSTEAVDCFFEQEAVDRHKLTPGASVVVPAHFDEYTRTVACIAPPMYISGAVNFELRLRGPDEAAQGKRITNTVQYSYYDREQIYRIHPSYGPRFGGTDVTVEGSFFFGEGTVNELYCIFNGVRTLATYDTEHKVKCRAPPEVSYTRALRDEAVRSAYESATATGDSFGIPHPDNSSDIRDCPGWDRCPDTTNNGLPYDPYALPDTYGFEREELLTDGDFSGEVNGPIFIQSLIAKTMSVMQEVLTENTTGFQIGLTEEYVFGNGVDVTDAGGSEEELRVEKVFDLYGNPQLDMDGRHMSATEQVSVEVEMQQLLMDIQKSIIDGLRSAPATVDAVSLAAQGKVPTETTIGDLSFPYADGRAVRDSSEGQQYWLNSHGNETVLTLAQKELKKMRARATAKEHEDTLLHYYRNGVEVTMDPAGAAPEAVPTYDYPASERFVYDFGFHTALQAPNGIDTHDKYSHLHEPPVCEYTAAGVAINCVDPPFSFLDVVAKSIEQAFPLSDMKNTSSLYPCWGLNSSDIHLCYGFWNETHMTSNGTALEFAENWIMTGLDRAVDIDALQPIPKASYGVCTKGVIQDENEPHRATGVVHDGTPGAPYEHFSRATNCGRLIRAPAGSVVRLTFTEFELRDTDDYLRVYDGGSTFAPRIGAFDGFDDAKYGTLYSTGEEMLLHFHVAALPPVIIEINPVTGLPVPPPPPPPQSTQAGFSAEYAFVKATMLSLVNVTLPGETDDDETVEFAVIADSTLALGPESVISFYRDPNMTQDDFLLSQQAMNFSVDASVVDERTRPVAQFALLNQGTGKLDFHSPTTKLESAPKYECMMAWEEWVSPTCCPGVNCNDGLPSVCSAFCAPVFSRWWHACEVPLNGTTFEMPIAVNDTWAGGNVNATSNDTVVHEFRPYLHPTVYSDLSDFARQCSRTVTPETVEHALMTALDKTVTTALAVEYSFRKAEKFERKGALAAEASLPAVLPVAFELTMNGQQLTSDAIEFSYYDEAEVYSIQPLIGPDSGTTKLQVSGSNFIDSIGLTCLFGDLETNAIYSSSTLVYCVAPKPSNTGLQEIRVRVSNNRQQYTLVSKTFDYYTAPNISAVTPSAGPVHGGTLVYVDGDFFISRTLNSETSISCRFGYTVVTATLVTSRLITCLAPTHTPGTFHFSISFNDQQYTEFPFYFTFYGVDLIYPPLGPLAGDTDVMITGRGFASGLVDASLHPRCRFGELFVDADVHNSTHMVCITPAFAQEAVLRFDISFSGNQWTQSGKNYSYWLPASVAAVEPSYQDRGLGPSTGYSRVLVEGRNFIDVEYLRCRFSSGKLVFDVQGFFISNTSMYCMSPPVELEREQLFTLEMSFNDQQYSQSMTGTMLPYLYYPSFVLTTREPNSAPYAGGNLLGSFEENAARTVEYTVGDFDYTEITIEGENFVSGDLTLCRWKRAFSATEVLRYEEQIEARTDARAVAIENKAAQLALALAEGQAEEDIENPVVVPPLMVWLTKCDKHGCYTIEEENGCTCNVNVEELLDDPLTEDVDESETFPGDHDHQVSCDSPNAPGSCGEGGQRRIWSRREGCYIDHDGTVPGCPTDTSSKCCFNEVTLSADVISTSQMVCKTIDFPSPSGYRWTPDNSDFHEASVILEKAQTLGDYIDQPFIYDFDVTRNGQDYSAVADRLAAGAYATFTVFGARSITYIQPGSGPAEGGLVTSLYGVHMVNSPYLEIRFGKYTAPGQVICDTCMDATENFALINMTNLQVAGGWTEENLWDVKYVSNEKIQTINPYHGQTAKVDVVMTSNGQQYELSRVQYSYSSSSAAMTEVTGAADGALAGEWATFRIEAREANGAAKIEGGDVFVVTLLHTHPNYQRPACMHCPNGVQQRNVEEIRCRETTGGLGHLCPYEMRSGLSGAAEESAEVTVTNPYGDGQYIVTYMTTISGLYDLEIQLAGKHVPGSPFAVEIMYADIMTETTLVYGPGLDEVKAGYGGVFNIQARDEYHNNRTIGRDMPSFCVDITWFESLDDGTCSFCHPCPFPDKDGIYWGRHADYPANPLADGVVVPIPMRDECVILFGNQVDDIVEKETRTDCEVSDCGIICDELDGTYEVTWTAIEAKQYTIQVARENSRVEGEGTPVPGSPFGAAIVAGDTSVFGCLSTGEGRFRGVAGVPETIVIDTADLYGNVKTYGGDIFPWEITRIENGVEYKIDGIAEDNGDGSYEFTYIATTASTYTLNVKLIAQLYPAPGEFIVDSPWFNVKVQPAPAAATNCIASGENVYLALSGYSSTYWIKAYDMYDNARSEGGDKFTVTLDGPQIVPDCKDAPGTEPDCVNVLDMSFGEYIVAYTADISGAYNMSVTLSQTNFKGTWVAFIKDAPFFLQVVPEAPTVLALSPRSGPISGDTLVSFSLAFATDSGPQSRDDFETWLAYLGHTNMTVKLTGWDGVDVDGDPVTASGNEYEGDAWYDMSSGLVNCYTRSFVQDIEAYRIPMPGKTSYSTAEVKAELMQWTRSKKQLYFYNVPVQVTEFYPKYGPDSGFTAISVEGNNMVTNAIIDTEVRCKLGDKEAFQATFIQGTGILLCLSDDYRSHIECGPAWGGADCPPDSLVPLTVALNGQQYTADAQLFKFYRTPVEVHDFTPLSGPISGGTSTTVEGVNFMDTGIITCKWGADLQAVAPAQYVDGNVVCASPNVLVLYSTGDYALRVALNGAQYSTVATARVVPSFFFYTVPHIATVLPEYGVFTGGSEVDLLPTVDSPFVKPSGTNQITCRFIGVTGAGVTAIVAGEFDTLTGGIHCLAPTVKSGMTAKLEVALNGQQYTNDQKSFAFTPVVTAMDMIMGPTSGNTRIEVWGSGFIDAGERLMCRFTDLSGTVDDQLLVAEEFISNTTIICRSPPNDLVNPYPNMYPTRLEISLDACTSDDIIAADSADIIAAEGELGSARSCRTFADHYSETGAAAADVEFTTTTGIELTVGNMFSFYEDPIVETLGFEPYNSGLMDGVSIGYPPEEGAELTIGGQSMVTVADPMPRMYCGFMGVPDLDGVMTDTFIIIEAVVNRAAQTVSCPVPGVDEPQDVAVELSMNSQQYTDYGITFNYYDPERAPSVAYMRPKSGPKEGGTEITFYGVNMANVPGVDCRFNNVTSGNVHPVVSSYVVNYFPQFRTAWSMTCITAKNFHTDTNMPGADDEREDAGTANVDITNGDLGNGMLWSVSLPYEFTETFAPFCSAYLPEFDPRDPDFWSFEPTEMDAEFTMIAIAGERVEFRMKARDKNRHDRPYGADVFYIDLIQQCGSLEPGHMCRWDEEAVFEWVESIDLDPTFNEDLRMNYPELADAGQYIGSVLFTISGDYEMAINLAGESIQDSPWAVYVQYGDVAPDASTFYGDGLKGTVAGVGSSFYIQARDLFANNRTVDADCSLGSDDSANPEKCDRWTVHAEVDVQAADQVYNQPIKINSWDGVVAYGDSGNGIGNLGLYLVDYVTNKAGAFNVSITLNGTHVGGSPTLITVTPDITDTLSCTANGTGAEQYGLGVVEAGSAGEFIIVSRDVFGNARLVGGEVFNVTMHGEEHPEWYYQHLSGELDLRDAEGDPRVIGVNELVANVDDRDDSSFAATYLVTVAGKFRTEVTRNGEHIMGSPFVTIVQAAETHGPTCTAVGNGISGGIAGDSFAIDIQAKDPYYNDQTLDGDNFTVILQGSEVHNNMYIRDIPTEFEVGGIYAGVYNNTVSGFYTLSITASGASKTTNFVVKTTHLTLKTRNV